MPSVIFLFVVVYQSRFCINSVVSGICLICHIIIAPNPIVSFSQLFVKVFIKKINILATIGEFAKKILTNGVLWFIIKANKRKRQELLPWTKNIC
jgi:hypothetical protein